MVASVRKCVARLLVFLTMLVAPLAAPAQDARLDDPKELERHTYDLSFGNPRAADTALEWFADRGDPDAIAAIITALRFGRASRHKANATLATLAGVDPNAADAPDSWFEWMLWQQAHPEIKPNAFYLPFKLANYERRIDAGFHRFFPSGDIREIADIRIEEIAWGGVRIDGIPPLDEPTMIAAADADYLLDNDLVFGVSINGDARAYPLRILGWHEMMNDTVGGQPLALAYCTLCGAGVLYATDIDHPRTNGPLIFSSTGLLYRSNKLMYDRQTDTVWDHFAGKPVMGPLRGSGIVLEVLPMVTTTWADWREANPQTTVVSLNTGFRRNYGSGVVYADYFASPDLMFPARLTDDRLRQKDRVFALRMAGGSKAWPIDMFEGGEVINDRVGLVDVVLVGNTAARTVRAYERSANQSFGILRDAQTIEGPSGDWQVTEDALVGPDGERLGRLPGHIAYWFAWAGNMGELAELPETAENSGN